MRRGIVAVLIMISLAGAATAQPFGPASTGTFTFEAPSYEHYGAFRSGQSQPGNAAITVWLPQVPSPTARDGRVAAVVIGHSIGGWKDGSEGSYVRPLLEAGYAVLGLDHFGPRGIKRAADVPGAISPITPVSDALLALKLAATHPAIDPARIGIMGLSMGGITSEHSAYEFVRRRVLGNSDLKFAAHVPFYAPCANVFSNDGGPVTTGAPMLKLYGGRDETTPREKCERIDAVARAAEPGLRWQSHWYPEAYHAWENPANRPAFHPNHVNARKCPVTDFGSRVRFIDPDGRERPFDVQELQACIKASSGYSMGYSPEAAGDARKRMLAFFAEHLKPQGL